MFALFSWLPDRGRTTAVALENLSDADLELITLYAYEEHDTVEIPRTPHTGRNEPGG